jgi:hypothetical protein
MRRPIRTKLAIAGVVGVLSGLPALACDDVGVGSGYYGYGPSWGYNSAYYAAPVAPYYATPAFAYYPAPRAYYYTAPAYGYAAPSYGYGYSYYRAGYRGWRRW